MNDLYDILHYVCPNMKWIFELISLYYKIFCFLLYQKYHEKLFFSSKTILLHIEYIWIYHFHQCCILIFFSIWKCILFEKISITSLLITIFFCYFDVCFYKNNFISPIIYHVNNIDIIHNETYCKKLKRLLAMDWHLERLLFLLYFPFPLTKNENNNNNNLPKKKNIKKSFIIYMCVYNNIFVIFLKMKKNNKIFLY